jgi:hypothetical protein
MQKIAILYDASQAVLSTWLIARDYFRRELGAQFKSVVAVLFLSIFDVHPAQFFEINLIIVSPAVAKNE